MELEDIKILVKHGATFGESNFMEIIFRLANMGRTRTVKFLLEMFPNDIDFTTTFTSEHFDGKLNILEALCRFDNVDVLDLLVKHGGDLSQMPNFDNNPILYCCRYKSWKAVKYLLDHSSNNKIPVNLLIQQQCISIVVCCC
jgi:hypothetical protein